ncbi:MAG: hypothetical protein AB8I08_29565 [Sandaracinaceae bacterium]
MNNDYLIAALSALLMLTACGGEEAEAGSSDTAEAPTDEAPATAEEAPPAEEAPAAFSCDALMDHIVELYAGSERPAVDARTRGPLAAGCAALQGTDGWAAQQEAAQCSMGAADEAALLACGAGPMIGAFGRAATQ